MHCPQLRRRLGRCASAITGEGSALPRVKPFKYTYEKEIVMYAYFKKLDYFSTECIYAPYAARGLAREFVKELELARPAAIVDLITSAEQFRLPSAHLVLYVRLVCRMCAHAASVMCLRCAQQSQ